MISGYGSLQKIGHVTGIYNGEVGSIKTDHTLHAYFCNIELEAFKVINQPCCYLILHYGTF